MFKKKLLAEMPRRTSDRLAQRAEEVHVHNCIIIHLPNG